MGAGQFQERDLSGEDVVALFLDGKTFADSTMVIALGITISGEERCAKVDHWKNSSTYREDCRSSMALSRRTADENSCAPDL